MNPLRFDAQATEHDQEVQAQLGAYNTAFAELGLRFRWDEATLVSLATIDGELSRIAAYIEAHHTHLLNAYSAEFLSQAILEKKAARHPACLATTSAKHSASTGHAQDAAFHEMSASRDADLLSLAGA